MSKISPFLWFDNEAEQAANFYVSIFEDSRILNISRYHDDGQDPAGKVMTVTFELAGQEVTALNGGPHFKLNEAFSFFVRCGSQEEVDELWAKLTEGGEESQCGWLKDQYGLSWQIIPTVLTELLQDEDREKAGRVMEAMLQMRKIDIRGLETAYHQT